MYITRTPYREIAILTDLEVRLESMSDENIQLNNWFAAFVETHNKRFGTHEKLMVRTWFTLPLQTRKQLYREIERRVAACDKAGINDLSAIMFELFNDAKQGKEINV